MAAETLLSPTSLGPILSAFFALYPDRIAACVAFRSIRYSSTKRACFGVGFPASRKGFSAPGDAGASVSARPALDVAFMAGDNTRCSQFSASLPNGCRGRVLVLLMAMLADAAGVWRPERSSLHGPVRAGIAGSSG